MAIKEVMMAGVAAGISCKAWNSEASPAPTNRDNIIPYDFTHIVAINFAQT